MGKSEDDHTEFNFSDNGGDFAPAAPSSMVSPNVMRGSSSRFANMDKRKVMLIAVGSIVGILIVFKLLGWIMSPSKPAPAPATVVTAIQPAAQMNAVVEGRLQAQSMQLAKTQQKVAQLETTLVDMQTQLTMLNQAIQSMSLQMQQLAAAKAAPPPPPMKKTGKKTPVFTYYIQAMIPGRAWLVNQKGIVTTVSIGDELPGFGTVTNIDREQGTVSTDKETIRFHPGDR